MYHHRVVISRPAEALKKVMLLKYHDNVGHPNYRRLMDSILKRYWWDKMVFDYKLYCQHCVACKRAKPDHQREAALQHVVVL